MIKVLVSTTETQGKRENDFCFVPEGDFVFFGNTCDKDKNNPDGSCGCDRSMIGISNRKATTTVKVVNVEMTKEEYIDKLWDSQKNAWELNDDDKADFVASASVDTILKAADYFPVNAVLEYRSGVLDQRN